VAVWWLAVRIVARRPGGPFEWVFVAVLAFGVPMLVADTVAVSAPGFEGLFLFGWGATAAAIAAVWVIGRVPRRQARRRAEQDADSDSVLSSARTGLQAERREYPL
jgi:hypothetical protein